jgi:hypothetical protein
MIEKEIEVKTVLIKRYCDCGGSCHIEDNVDTPGSVPLRRCWWRY